MKTRSIVAGIATAMIFAAPLTAMAAPTAPAKHEKAVKTHHKEKAKTKAAKTSKLKDESKAKN